MDKLEFYDIVAKYIVPLFTGSHLVGEMESSARDNEVALGKGNTILLKPTKTDNYRLVLKRGQAFKTFELELVRAIVLEINAVYSLEIDDKMYLQSCMNMALERALIDSLTENGTDTILGIINRLETWSSRTYEGSAVKLGVMVNLGYSMEGPTVTYSDIMSQEFFALFTDGTSTFVEFDKKGKLIGYVNLKKTKTVPTVSPNIFDRLARSCSDRRVGIVLTEKGDILVFYAYQLIFAKRNGKWGVYSHDEVIRLLYNNVSYSAKEIRRSLYNTALDCSFAYKGACLCYINKDRTLDALNHIDAADIISEAHFEMKKKLELEEAEKLYNLPIAQEIVDRFSMSYDEFLDRNNYIKTKAIRKVVAGKKLFELDRKFVQEMTSIDGATVVDYDGTIIAVGAIIKIEAGSMGGGRLAATTTMAKYGVAIKVSQDGIMQGYGVDKSGKVKQLFNVG